MTQVGKAPGASAGYLWRVTVLGGAAATVLAALVLRIFPWSGTPRPVSGTLLADTGLGQIAAADAGGKNAPATVVFPPLRRTAANIRRFDRNIRFLSVTSPWWDTSASAFVTSAAFSDPGVGWPPLLESSLEYFSSEGQPESGIASSRTHEFGPLSISPDGSWIAAEVEIPVAPSRSSNGLEMMGHIMVSPLKGCCHTYQLLEGWGRPSWSPDGQQLAYKCSPHHGSPQLCIDDVADRKWRVVSTPGAENIGDPVWSPDNRTVAVIANIGRGGYEQILAIDSVTGSFTQFTDNAKMKEDPQWSPSGDQIAYIGSDGVWIMNLQNRRDRLFLRGKYQELQWTTDGTQGFGS